VRTAPMSDDREVRCSNGHPLEPEHTGPCPVCGITTRNISMNFTAPVGVEASVQRTTNKAFEATVDVIVVSLGQLPDALKNDPRELFVKAPTWWPHILLFLFALLVLLQLSVPSILAFKGVARGYNVELCPKLTYKGLELSNCVKLTKPTP
jgi:hypothetical protein